MSEKNAIVAVFSHHAEADSAIRKLSDAGLDMKHFSVIGKGYHTEEKVIGFYNTGDRVKMWGKNGAFWGGIWGLLFGGILFTIPFVGHIMVLGHLAGMVYGMLEAAIVVGGLSALGAALYSIGIPKNSVIQYEEALKADGFLVIAQGSADEVARARDILSAEHPAQLDVHTNLQAPAELAPGNAHDKHSHPA